MTKTQHAIRFALSIVAVFALFSLATLTVRAQGFHDHDDAGRGVVNNELVKVVREVTRGFQNVDAAEAAGYALQFGCVSGPDAGAMGLHYVNGPLVMDGVPLLRIIFWPAQVDNAWR